MILFIGEEFEKLDDIGFNISEYVADELGMDKEIIKINKNKIKKEIQSKIKTKFSILIFSNLNKIEEKEIIKICKKQKNYCLNINYEKFDIQDLSYDIIDKIEKNKVLSYSKLWKVYDIMQQRITYNVYDEFFEKYIDHGKFLELGAGSGIVTKKLKQFNLEILATDLNKNFLEVLEKKNLGVKTRCIDICKIDEYDLDTNYNYVGMFLDTLNYINPIYLNNVFLNIHNILAPGGIFIFDIHESKKTKDFEGYIEEIQFEDFRFHWLSKKESNYVVSHNFTFINEELSYEKHIQYILPLKDYQDQYLQYFKEIAVKHVNGRIIIVLEKA